MTRTIGSGTPEQAQAQLDAMGYKPTVRPGINTPESTQAELDAMNAGRATEQAARAHEQAVGDLARALDISAEEAAQIIEGKDQ